MNEQSGVLRPAVEAYLNDAPMTEMQIAAMRAYLRQWINSDVWDTNPHAKDADRANLANMRRLVDNIRTRADIKAWIEIAIDEGLDPL